MFYQSLRGFGVCLCAVICAYLQGCHKPINAAPQIPISSPCNVPKNQQETQQENKSLHTKDSALDFAKNRAQDFANNFAQDFENAINLNFAHLNASIISTQNPSQNLAFADFIAKLADSHIVLLGEKHDEKSHHQAQLLILQALEARFLGGVGGWIQGEDCERKITLVLEMLSGDSAKHIERANLEKQGISKENLKTALGWGEWDYAQYKDIVEYAFFSRSFEIVAGNLGRDEMREIYKNPQNLTGAHSANAQVQATIGKIIAKSHKTNDKNLLNKLMQIQQHKDRAMATKLFNAPNFALLIAGNYHITKTFGIPLHIADLAELAQKSSTDEKASETNADKAEHTQKAIFANKIISKKVASAKIASAKIASVGMIKAKHLKSKKNRDKILSHYDYILLFR